MEKIKENRLGYVKKDVQKHYNWLEMTLSCLEYCQCLPFYGIVGLRQLYALQPPLQLSSNWTPSSVRRDCIILVFFLPFLFQVSNKKKKKKHFIYFLMHTASVPSSSGVLSKMLSFSQTAIMRGCKRLQVSCCNDLTVKCNCCYCEKARQNVEIQWQKWWPCHATNARHLLLPLEAYIPTCVKLKQWKSYYNYNNNVHSPYKWLWVNHK